MRLGFIGLGIMGRPMAKHLLDAGHTLTVWNRSRPGIEALLEAGADEGASPADVAAKSEVVFTMVGDSPDVEAIALGDNGIIERRGGGPHPHRHDHDRPRSSRGSIAERYAERGIELLDAPVSGGEGGAINATLSIMVGGKPEVFERCKPLARSARQNDHLLRPFRRRPDGQAVQPGRRLRHQHGGLRSAGPRQEGRRAAA